jgi:hypothetical protein
MNGVTLLLRFEDGTPWEILEGDVAHALVRSSRPSPPGSTLEGTAEGESRAYRVKVRSCRRTHEGDLPFSIEGRFVDLTREQREKIPVKARPDRP